jgi:hypothetical protein
MQHNTDFAELRKTDKLELLFEEIENNYQYYNYRRKFGQARLVKFTALSLFISFLITIISGTGAFLIGESGVRSATIILGAVASFITGIETAMEFRRDATVYSINAAKMKSLRRDFRLYLVELGEAQPDNRKLEEFNKRLSEIDEQDIKELEQHSEKSK